VKKDLNNTRDIEKRYNTIDYILIRRHHLKILSSLIFLMIIIPIFLVSIPISVPKVGDTIISINPTSQSISVGDTFQIQIEVDPAEPIKGVSCSLKFDSSIVTVNSVTPGEMFAMSDGGSINNDAGIVKGMFGIEIGGTINPGILATVNFTAENEGTSLFNLVDVSASDDNDGLASTYVKSGMVTIGEEGGDLQANAGDSYIGNVNESIQLYGSATGGTPPYSYSWDLDDDGEYDDSAYKNPNYTWSITGSKTVRLKVTDSSSSVNIDTDSATVEVWGKNYSGSSSNNPPTKPIIVGPNTGNINTEYSYNVVSNDPDNDAIKYSFIWGDQTSYVTESGFLPNGSVYTASHIWLASGEYNISIWADDNKNLSETTMYTVYIDVFPINDQIKGYLVDDNSDGTYDSFENSRTGEKTDVTIQDDGTYLIDIEGDGNWDFVYDVESLTISKNAGPNASPESEDDNTAIYVLVLIIIIILIIVFVYLLKRGKDN